MVTPDPFHPEDLRQVQGPAEAFQRGESTLNEKDPEVRYGLWAGYRESKRWIAAREDWADTDYRIAGGVIHRLATHLRAGSLDLEVVRAPLATEIPDVVRLKLEQAERAREAWLAEGDFAGLARVAWAWAPPGW